MSSWQETPLSVTDELLANNARYAETFADDGFKRSIQDDTGVKPQWSAEAFPDLDEDGWQPVARIRNNPFVPRKAAVRGFVVTALER